jgi:DNA-binding beta-propeller fold protein YncE
MIYAQGSHDDALAIQEINDLSQRLCAQTFTGKQQTVQCDNGKIKVAYDDDSSWPFVWYLRNYTSAQFYGKTPSAPFDAPVVLVGSANQDAVKPFLGNKYISRQYKLIWWPLEGYKELTLERVLNYFRDPQQRADLFTAWFYHQYKESANSWPYAHIFTINIRKDVTAMLWNYAGNVPQQPAVQDEYDTKFVKLTASRSIGTPGSSNGQLMNPKNVAIDPQGSIYVADSDNGRIEKFDSKGEFVRAWGTKSPPNAIGPQSTFSELWGIAVDKNSNVYVADTWNHRIQKFDKDGKFLTMWGTNGDTHGIAQGNPLQFYGPRSIAIDKQGNVLVTDTGNKRVLKFSPNGEPIDQYGGVGADPGQFLEEVGIAVDKDGNIYVADTWNQRIQKFDANFNFVSQWLVEAWDSQSVVNKPYIAVDPDGNVFITDPELSRIIKFSNEGKLLAVFGSRGSDLSSFNLPIGLAFDAQGNLYVADSGNNRILVFSKP